MANNYTFFSEMITGLSPEAVAWVETILALNIEEDEAALKELRYELGLDEKTNEDDLASWPAFQWQIEGAEKNKLWLYSEEGLIDDHLIWFVQALIRKFLPSDYVFTASFACTCSKPRVGEFGGYWLAISKDKVESGNTWDAASEAAVKLQEG